MGVRFIFGAFNRGCSTVGSLMFNEPQTTSSKLSSFTQFCYFRFILFLLGGFRLFLRLFVPSTLVLRSLTLYEHHLFILLLGLLYYISCFELVMGVVHLKLNVLHTYSLLFTHFIIFYLFYYVMSLLRTYVLQCCILGLSHVPASLNYGDSCGY